MILKTATTIQTPAKVNFYLNIQRKRDDGYHELLMDLVPISLYDTIRFSPSEKKGLSLSCNIEGIPFEENLVIKAVRALEKETGHQFYLHLDLTKVIPSGAGLGGGSGNAAGVLTTLNDLFKLNISDDRLEKLALKLGADVPFFIKSKPVMAEGIGEIFTPIENFPKLYLILIYPNLSISTGEAYRGCLISGRKTTIQKYTHEELKNCTAEQNDFWTGLSITYPVLQIAQKKLSDLKAIYTFMSGSGSSIVGVFESKESRDKALKQNELDPLWTVFPCETLI
ncbi:MAG: 4-diphosphocytidyl-2-C-methyl-D-erythritol kinase [bacterium]|jgi:4-diphosphocytidyl-2-C-methyl-D-erythritol kinase